MSPEMTYSSANLVAGGGQMIKALKVTMTIWGATALVFGLMYIVNPVYLAGLVGFGQIADYVRWIMASSGAVLVAVGVWVMVAARDPVRHINWVRFEITKTLLFFAVTAGSMVQGYVSFSQVGWLLIMFAVFAVAFLVLYPRRALRRT
jgi:hypothetical protein